MTSSNGARKAVSGFGWLLLSASIASCAPAPLEAEGDDRAVVPAEQTKDANLGSHSSAALNATSSGCPPIWKSDIRIDYAGPEEDVDIIRTAIADLPNLPIVISVNNRGANFFIRPFGHWHDIEDNDYCIFGTGCYHISRGYIKFPGTRDWPDYDTWNAQGYVFQLRVPLIGNYAENSGVSKERAKANFKEFRMYPDPSINIFGGIFRNHFGIYFAECNYFVDLPKFIKKKLFGECLLRGLGLVKSSGPDDESLLRSYGKGDVDNLPQGFSPGDLTKIEEIYANDECGGPR